MSLFDKTHLVAQADALPGRNTPMPVATLHAVNGHSMTNVPDGMEVALFAMGCFWGVERLFWQLPGVYSTAAGYTGGYTPNPTYREVCTGDTGHAEAVKIDFDPAVVSYRVLLEIFFTIHDPTTLDRQGNDVGSQYRSVIYATSASQLASARALVEEMGEARVFAQSIVTQVEPAPVFWPAEAEHHDYYTHNSNQPYCQYVVAPKVAKFHARFAELRRRDDR